MQYTRAHHAPLPARQHALAVGLVAALKGDRDAADLYSYAVRVRATSRLCSRCNKQFRSCAADRRGRRK